MKAKRPEPQFYKDFERVDTGAFIGHVLCVDPATVPVEAQAELRKFQKDVLDRYSAFEQVATMMTMGGGHA
ncbi:hypothetical protein [Polymorphobacter sp.]|uniref:hypothetical protein n=1 Tax=Polymorphobacter sp. TaxID=1909290 RepID=UPI003F6F08F9